MITKKTFWLVVGILCISILVYCTITPPRSEKIASLTQPDKVIRYLQNHAVLPPYYVTKRQARYAGWQPHLDNLCQVLPGKAIGGDRFMNRGHQLPQDRQRVWYEADINYHCGKRNGERLLYSNDRLIYLTVDHYQTFHKVHVGSMK